jgi:thioredoxin 1
VLQGGTNQRNPLAQAVPKGMAMLNGNENLGTKENAARTAYLPEKQFEAEVLYSKQPVLVAFETLWSRPCQVQNSILQELACDWSGTLKVVKINADDSLDLSLCYDIQSIPTVICFVEGKQRFRIVGTATKDAIVNKLKACGIADHIETLVKEASGAGAANSKGGLI